MSRKLLGLVICAISVMLIAAGCSQDEPGINQGFPKFISLKNGEDSQIGYNKFIQIKDGYISAISFDNNDINDSEGNAILNLGKLNTLDDIKEIPSKGWSEGNQIRAEIGIGNSYILRFRQSQTTSFAVFRIVEIIDRKEELKNNNPIIKAELIYPFIVPIRLSANSLSFDNDGGESIIKFKSPASATLKEAPDWVEVSIFSDSVKLKIYPNLNSSARNGDIKIENPKGIVSIHVKQNSGNIKFAGGDGSKENPYLVATATQFNRIRLNPDKHYRQTADIDLADVIKSQGGSWIPILNFSGSYDGGMHRITNLEIEGIPDYVDVYIPGVALFVSAKNAEFKNIRLHINGIGDSMLSNNSAAGICAAGKDVKIYRCSVEGEVICGGYACGIADASGNSIVSECYTDVLLSGTGLFGIASCDVENCYVLKNLNAQYRDRWNTPYTYIGYTAKNCYIVGKYTGEYELYNYDNNTTTIIPYGEFASKEAISCYSLVETSEADMKRRATYVGWDFDNVWTIDEGVSYPRLRCFEK